MTSRLTEMIAPPFYPLHNSIKCDEYTHYWLKGGRGSLKSSFISIEMPLGIMTHPRTNGVALRKVGQNLKDSVYSQLVWGIEKLGALEKWQAKLSPLELVYIPTGQKILFRGADDPKKIKSIKVQKGYIRYLWYEELDEFSGMEEIRSINQSIMRGGNKFDIFYSYNPPPSQRSWVNTEALEKRPDKIVHHSTYLGAPPEWLGEQFILEAEHLKAVKPISYAHEYLGEVTGTGGEIFDNLDIRAITDEEVQRFDKIRLGIDFGYSIDPFVYIVCHFDKKRKRLFIFDEIYKVGLSNAKAADMIKQKGRYETYIICDSEEPKSIAEMRALGLKAKGAKKGPDSVEYGIKFLQSMESIIIDPVRCPNAKREFYEYEYERDRNGDFKASYPDKNNHCIDAVRYALEDDMVLRAVNVRSRSEFGI